MFYKTTTWVKILAFRASTPLAIFASILCHLAKEIANWVLHPQAKNSLKLGKCQFLCHIWQNFLSLFFGGEREREQNMGATPLPFFGKTTIHAQKMRMPMARSWVWMLSFGCGRLSISMYRPNTEGDNHNLILPSNSDVNPTDRSTVY